MSRTLRVGLVGCGRLAERAYLPAFARARGVELVAVADVELSRCATAAPGVPAFDSAAALVAAAAPDALIVATPPGTHVEVATLAAAAGLAALVEKPPALDAAGARALAGLVPAPWIGFNRRFEPALQRLASRLPHGGALELELEFSYRRASWAAHAAAGDVLSDVGTHLLDLARWLGGGLGAVRAAAVGQDRAEVELELGRGRALVSMDGDRPYRERLVVRDGNGRTLGGHVTGGRLRAIPLRLGVGGQPLVASLAAQLEAFATAAGGGPAPVLATAQDGLAVMEAIDSARRLAAQ